MASRCLGVIRACATRVTRLEGNGVPDPGTDNMFVTDSLISLRVDAELEEGEETIVKNACDDLCLNFKSEDKLKRYTLTMSLCKPIPELEELLAGGKLYTGETKSGEVAAGYGAPSIGGAAVPNGVSLELWAQQVNVGGEVDAIFPYQWYVFPKVFMRPFSRNFERGPMQLDSTGFAVENANWFDGPENDWPDPPADRAMNYVETDTKPEATCGLLDVAVS